MLLYDVVPQVLFEEMTVEKAAEVMVMAFHIALVQAVGLFAGSLAALRRQQVHQQSDCQGDDEEHPEKQQGLAGEHSQHNEGLVAAGSYHHSHKGSEGQHPVGIQRHCGESADTAGDKPHHGAEKHPGEAIAVKPGKETAVGSDVDELNQEHHQDHQGGDQDAFAQHVCEYVDHILPRYLSISSSAAENDSS